MRIEVDPQVLADSGRRLGSIGSQLGMLSDALGAAVGSGIASGMDPAGLNFGIKYGRQAQQFADALAKAVEAHEVVGFMLEATGYNYQNADAASTIGGPGPTGGVGGQPGKTTAADVPMGPSGAVVPPPTKWAILQPFLGPMMSWPSGNPSLLRVTAAQWRNLATGLSAFDGDMAALESAVAQQEIPEGGKIGQALSDLDEGVTTLADMAKTIGQSVDDFAGGVQDTQDAIRRLMDRISLDGLWDTVTGFLTGEGDDILREIAHDVGEVLENFQNQVKGVVGLLEELTIALGLAADAFQRWIRPILVETFGDDVGNALADSVTLYTDFQVGLTTGLINTVSGVVSMADVDTWKGMAELAQSVAEDPSTLPGVLANMGKEFVAWDKWSGDHPGRAAGEAAFNIGSLFVPGGALSKTGSVAKGLSYTTRLFDEGRLPRLSDVPGLGGGDRLPDLNDVPGGGRGLPEMPEFRPGTVPDSVIGPFAPNGAGTPTSPSAPGGPARSGDSTGTTPPGGRGQGTGGEDGPPVASPEPTTGSPDPETGAAAGPGRGDSSAPVNSGAPAASSGPSPADAAPSAAPGGSPVPDSASGKGSGETRSDPGTSAAAHAGGEPPRADGASTGEGVDQQATEPAATAPATTPDDVPLDADQHHSATGDGLLGDPADEPPDRLPEPDDDTAVDGPRFNLDEPLSHMSPELRVLSEQFLTGSGETVLGPFNPPGGGPSYIAVAEDRGASYFSLGDRWEEFSPIEQLAANQHVLDVAIANGDVITFSVDLEKIREGSYTEAELRYLEEHGYRRSGDRTLLPPP
ncbi:WXG100-like domain-containing protein [Mycolicibacterium lacusdiani]|uniref:WXG100-like domain-containing protein n=1 Tax=Mycolicibacterium lacusdiani TaxID=2895283 RepID=UPI001F305093|nr:PE domain-containing protein [Mycolicibacterium lacusdiani]